MNGNLHPLMFWKPTKHGQKPRGQVNYKDEYMPGFTFDAELSFEENFELFLGELDSSDSEMSTVLRAHLPLLEDIIRDGNRDLGKREQFNQAVKTSLNDLLTKSAGD